MGKRKESGSDSLICVKCGRRKNNRWSYPTCYYCEPRYKADVDMEWRYVEDDLVARHAVYADIRAIKNIRDSLEPRAKIHVMPIYCRNIYSGGAVVAEREGRLVGWVRINRNGRFVLYVPPPERQSGVGGFLIRALQSKYSILIAHVDAVHEWKINFFAGYGFKYAFTEIRKNFRLKSVLRKGGRAAVYRDIVNYVMVWRRDGDEQQHETPTGCANGAAEQSSASEQDL